VRKAAESEGWNPEGHQQLVLPAAAESEVGQASLDLLGRKLSLSPAT